MVKVGASKCSPSSPEGREITFFVFKIAASTDDAQMYTQQFSLCRGLQTSALFRGLGGMETRRGSETQGPRSWSPGWLKLGSSSVSHRLQSYSRALWLLGFSHRETFPVLCTLSPPFPSPQEFLKTKSLTELLEPKGRSVFSVCRSWGSPWPWENGV